MEATNMHIEIAKYLWQIKLQKKSNMDFQDIEFDYDISIYL